MNSEMCGERRSRLLGLSDKQGIFARQFGFIVALTKWHQPKPGSMLHVSLWRDIFQIAQSRVALIAIDMVNTITFRRGAKECHCNKAVDESFVLPIMGAKYDLQVAVPLNLELAQLASAPAARDTSNPTFIGNFIQHLESMSGNRAPFFHETNLSWSAAMLTVNI